MVEAITFEPAERKNVALIIAIAGPSGAGKTLSALKIARGLCGGPEHDDEIAFIDTEAKRALHYAVTPGERPNEKRFGFRHGDLAAPFTPANYVAAIDAADRSGRFKCIVIDSGSHEWEGEGGCRDMHDDEVAKALEPLKERAIRENWRYFDEEKQAEKLNAGAWNPVKEEHKKLVRRILQCRTHVIICLRAAEKLMITTEDVKGTDGKTYKKTVYVSTANLSPRERYVPICEKSFMFEMTISVIVGPDAPGKPVPYKVQEQHQAALPPDQFMSEQTGRMLAEWASGGVAVVGEAPAIGAHPYDDMTADEVHADMMAVAARGYAALKDQWNGLSTSWQDTLRATINRENTGYAAIAKRADAARTTEETGT